MTSASSLQSISKSTEKSAFTPRILPAPSRDLSLSRQSIDQGVAMRCGAGRLLWFILVASLLPFPPPRRSQYNPGRAHPRNNVCPNDLPLVLVPLRWPFLKCPRMASFQMPIEVRSGRTCSGASRIRSSRVNLGEQTQPNEPLPLRESEQQLKLIATAQFKEEGISPIRAATCHKLADDAYREFAPLIVKRLDRE